MTIEEKIEMLEDKKLFIDHVSEAFERDLNSNVAKVVYEAYHKHIRPDTDYFREYVKVIFNGGGMSVRCVNGNSNNANFQEVGKLINGGYYDELVDYHSLPGEGFIKII